MIYAKCIRQCQIAKTRNEFLQRQNEEHLVYCEGETTISKYGETLDCVPLNVIYDCLKYGMYIAIIEVENNDTLYPDGNPMSLKFSSDRQKVTKIMPADGVDTVKFVIESIPNKGVLKFGYKSYLSDSVKKYIETITEE